MAAITYIRPDGGREVVDLPDGTTIKDGAIEHGIDGIVAECGGNAMCATCHVYVDPAWLGRLPPRTDVEDELLESTASERRPTSRLSCQLVVSGELDGLALELPEEQE